jgi:hypothetical protein
MFLSRSGFLQAQVYFIFMFLISKCFRFLSVSRFVQVQLNFRLRILSVLGLEFVFSQVQVSFSFRFL